MHHVHCGAGHAAAGTFHTEKYIGRANRFALVKITGGKKYQHDWCDNHPSGDYDKKDSFQKRSGVLVHYDDRVDDSADAGEAEQQVDNNCFHIPIGSKTNSEPGNEDRKNDEQTFVGCACRLL